MVESDTLHCVDKMQEGLGQFYATSILMTHGTLLMYMENS